MLESQPSVKAATIGEALGLRRSTVHRLVATLEHEGLLQRDRTQHSYRAGRVLVGIGIAAVGDLDVRKKARSYMQKLSASTGETVHLHVLEGPNTRIVDAVEGSQPVRVASHIGELLPAYSTAGGKALLAALPASELHALFPRGLSRITPTTAATWETLEAEIDAIRKRGYAVNRGETENGVGAVAVPVRDRSRRLVASLALALPCDRITDDRLPHLTAELREQAKLVGETLI